MTRWIVIVCLMGIFSCVTIVCASEQDNTGYEIIGHKFRLHLFPTQSALSCIDTISIHITSKHSPDKIGFRFIPLYTIEQITLRGKKSMSYPITGHGVSVLNFPRSQITV